MDKGLYFTTSKKKKKKTSRLIEDPILDKMIDDNDSVLTKGWDGGWETDLLPIPVSPKDIEKKAKQKFNTSARRNVNKEDISEISERFKAIQNDPNIQKDDVLPENDEVLQLIKERYLGLDEEHNRRIRLRDEILQVEKLQQIYGASRSPQSNSLLLDVASAQYQS